MALRFLILQKFKILNFLLNILLQFCALRV